MARVADRVDINRETLRNWVKADWRPTEELEVVSLEEEHRRLRRQLAEAERDKEMGAALGLFAAELCATRRRVCREVVRDHIRWVVVAA